MKLKGLHLYTRSRWAELEVWSQSPPPVMYFLQQAPPPEESTTCPNSATYKGPSVQILEPIVDIIHPDYYRG